jgi:hypothetical protein
VTNPTRATRRQMPPQELGQVPLTQA